MPCCHDFWFGNKYTLFRYIWVYMPWRLLNCFDFWLHCRLCHFNAFMPFVSMVCLPLHGMIIYQSGLCTAFFVLLFSLVVRHKIVFCIYIQLHACIQFIYIYICILRMNWSCFWCFCALCRCECLPKAMPYCGLHRFLL